MKTIKIKDESFTIEFSFEAALHKDLIQRMYDISAGTYFVRNADSTVDSKVSQAVMMFKGIADMSSDMPMLVRDAFYAGLCEHHNVTKEEAWTLCKEYMRENKLSIKDMNDELQKEMENDGFFDISGLTEMLNVLTDSKTESKKTADTKKKAKVSET